MLSSYKDFDNPQLHFVREVDNGGPFEAVLRGLSEICQVEDDTDINCDVCFTYILRCERLLVVKLSMVGPYAVILSFPKDDCGEGVLVGPGQSVGTSESAVMKVLAANGFFLVPAGHLETLVPLALVEGRTEVSLYSALFEPEGVMPWVNGV